MSFTYSKLTVEGLTLRIGRNGVGAPHDAVPLLMLNGIGFNAELMEPLARQFPGRHIVCPDMPGCGNSPDPVLPYTIKRVARAMESLMEREVPGRAFDILGFSWGGAVAQQLAVTASRKVARLALVATTSGLPLPAANPEVLRRLLDPTEYGHPAKLTDNFMDLLNEGGANAGLLRRFKSPTPQGVGCQVGALAGWSAAPMLPFLRMPVLLAGMAEDAIVPIAHQRALACLIPQAETIELRSGSHLLPLATPERIGPQLVDFFGQKIAMQNA
ncbi:alpha/beta fold hydrolase [Croceicoccus ponticola]|uniref:Alpha/beta fold hydrolase n=1 Tax=Croceicoccus ponticola TaxID=2217664 RepID=A0A437H1U2_9SPHN|nr:alpha/beta fold hydrolase [Croceicoccus ponticola]RVQ69492.1 alpha/beta fold hydrolase [Croceicoccus ponticola]